MPQPQTEIQPRQRVNDSCACRPRVTEPTRPIATTKARITPPNMMGSIDLLRQCYDCLLRPLSQCTSSLGICPSAPRKCDHEPTASCTALVRKYAPPRWNREWIGYDWLPSIDRSFRLLSLPAVKSLRFGESGRGPQCQSPRSCCWSGWANRRVLRRARTLTRPHSCSSSVRRDSQTARRLPLRSSDWAVPPCPPSTLPANRATWKSRPAASHLLAKIETALLTQPTYVRLDYEGTTLSELAQSLSRQTGFKIALYPQNLPRWKNQRVTLRRPELLPFWTAIDELCDTASLQYNPNMQGFAGQQDQVFALTEGVVRTADSDLGSGTVPGAAPRYRLPAPAELSARGR